jgi:hypothetical protein
MSASIDTPTDYDNPTTVPSDEIENCPLRVTMRPGKAPRVTFYEVPEGLFGTSQYSADDFHFVKERTSAGLDPAVHDINYVHDGVSHAKKLADMIIGIPGVLDGVVIGPYGVSVTKALDHPNGEVEAKILAAIAVHAGCELKDLEVWWQPTSTSVEIRQWFSC